MQARHEWGLLESARHSVPLLEKGRGCIEVEGCCSSPAAAANRRRMVGACSMLRASRSRPPAFFPRSRELSPHYSSTSAARCALLAGYCLDPSTISSLLPSSSLLERARPRRGAEASAESPRGNEKSPPTAQGVRGQGAALEVRLFQFNHLEAVTSQTTAAQLARQLAEVLERIATCSQLSTSRRRRERLEPASRRALDILAAVLDTH